MQILDCSRHRKRKNFIAMLQSDERMLTGHEEKAAEILEFYTNLIGTDDMRERTVDLDALDMPSFDLEALDNPILEEEVWNTIKSLPSDKAPQDRMALRVDSTKFVGQSSREI